MNIIDGIIQEIGYERLSTREVINRIPDDKWDWKPHEKSMTMGQLASHIVETFGWTESILGMDTFELDMETYKPYIASSKAELLAIFDQKIDDAIALMTGQSDEHVLGIWKMVSDGQVMIEMPRIGVIRMFTVSHTIHHRAQLSVYLRLNDIPVPSIYGPSADEQPAG